MRLVVVDSQGGGVGKLIIEKLRQVNKEIEIIGVGTNVLATQNMLKAGADKGASGENAIIVNASDADLIAGPLGIVIADSMLGEISANSANAIARSKAKKILIPFDNCGKEVVGVQKLKLPELIDLAVEEIIKIID